MQFNSGTYDIIIASDEQALEEVKNQENNCRTNTIFRFLMRSPFEFKFLTISNIKKMVYFSRT